MLFIGFLIISIYYVQLKHPCNALNAKMDYVQKYLNCLDAVFQLMR